MTYIGIVTALVFLVAGAVPPLLAHYLAGVRFMGGPWLASVIGVIGAATGSIIDALFLRNLTDLIALGGAVEIVPPLAGSLLFTVIYGFVSHSNFGGRSPST